MKDTKYASLREDTPPVMYQPFLQTNTGRGQMTLHVRLAGTTPGVAARVREEVQRLDPSMPLFSVYSLAEQMAGALSRERLVAILSRLVQRARAAAGVGGPLRADGVRVVRRTSEIGMRMALGAERHSLVRW